MLAAGSRSPERTRLLALVGVIAVLVLAVVILLTSRGDGGATRLAQSFVNAWSRGDYAQMYADVDPATRQTVSVTGFAARYRDALGTSTATGAVVGRAHGSGSGTVTVPVTLYTRIFGRIQAAFVLPVTGSGTAARIAWHPSLDFPRLRTGESL